MKERIEKILLSNTPIWYYKWIRGNERDKAVAFYTNEFLFSSNVNDVLESGNSDAVGMFIFYDLLVKEFGYRFFTSSSKSFPFEYVWPDKNILLNDIINNVAFTIGYNMKNDIAFFEAIGQDSHSLEVAVESQSFDLDKGHIMSSFDVESRETEEEILLDDIGKVSLASKYLIDELGSNVDFVQYINTLNELKSYFAVVKTKDVFKSEENKKQTDRSLGIYRQNIEEVLSGRKFGSLEKDFTMNELFLDSMYRLYLEPFEKLRAHGNGVAKATGYIPRMNR